MKLEIRVIMVEPEFEETIGSVARAMKNFGLCSLRLINPKASLGTDGRMRGGHAQEILDSVDVSTSLAEALRGIDLAIGTTAQRAHSSVNLLRRPMTPRDLGGLLATLSGSVAIVFGREGVGLTNQELSLCDALVTIPASDDYATLNLSHAAAIIFYELYLSREPLAKEELATEEVKMAIVRHLVASLTAAGLEDYKIALTIRACKNLLGRACLRRREASLIAGATRLISKAITSDNQRDSEAVASEVMSQQVW